MSVAISKKATTTKLKQASAPKVSAKVVLEPGQKAVEGMETEVDRLAELYKAVELFLPKFKEMKKIEEKLRKAAGEQVANTEGAVVVGTAADFVVSACGTSRKIVDMKGIRSAMGEKLFMDVATVTLGDVDKYLTEDQKAKVIEESNTGSRSGKLRSKG